MSDLSARQSVLSAAEANVRRLQQLQGFEKVYAARSTSCFRASTHSFICRFHLRIHP